MVKVGVREAKRGPPQPLSWPSIRRPLKVSPPKGEKSPEYGSTTMQKFMTIVPSGGRYQLQCSSRLLLHSSFLDWTTVTAFCLDFLPTSSRDSSLFRTLLRGSSSESEDQIILLTRSAAFTGCASQSAFPSNWLSWRTDQSTALHQLHTVVFHLCRRHDINTMAAVFYKYCPFVCLQSASGRSQLLAPTCGTTFRSTSHLHSHSRSSYSVSRLSSSLVPTRTSLYDLLIIIDYYKCKKTAV